jgi:uncharacterized protein YcbK (DUF882 family)
MRILGKKLGRFIREGEADLDRREFMGMGALACAVAFTARPSFASLPPVERKLSFLNLHTGERLKAVYSLGGEYDPRVLSAINRLLRDHRTGEVKAIDPKLLDLLYALKTKLGAGRSFHVISGYRSPATNAMLRKKSSLVGKNSLHMAGKAIDIRLPGIELSTLREAALELRGGGVGYYPSSNFVHVDTGRVRQWGA